MRLIGHVPRWFLCQVLNHEVAVVLRRRRLGLAHQFGKLFCQSIRGCFNDQKAAALLCQYFVLTTPKAVGGLDLSIQTSSSKDKSKRYHGKPAGMEVPFVNARNLKTDRAHHLVFTLSLQPEPASSHYLYTLKNKLSPSSCLEKCCGYCFCRGWCFAVGGHGAPGVGV